MGGRSKKPRTKLRYTIGRGYHVPKANADALFAVIRDVFKGEYPTPEDLIAEARKKRSPIHHLFEWDVRKAAKAKWRTDAQYYLRAIQVVEVNIETGEVVKEPVRAFVPVRVEHDHRIPPDNYIPVERLRNRPLDRAAVLERAERDFEAWLQRYERYTEFLEVFDPIIQAYRRAKKRIRNATKKRKRA